MIIFSKIKIFATLSFAAVAVILLAVAFWYVSGLRADLQQERANNQMLQQGIEQQQQVIDQMSRDIENIRRINQELNQESQRQQQESQALIERFNTTATGQSRDFGFLASQRPRAIERLVNRGTENALRCLELASGAEHTEQELNAILSSQINPECPTLANPNYRPLVR